MVGDKSDRFGACLFSRRRPRSLRWSAMIPGKHQQRDMKPLKRLVWSAFLPSRDSILRKTAMVVGRFPILSTKFSSTIEIQPEGSSVPELITGFCSMK